MKKIFFPISALALTLVFAFCSKADPTTDPDTIISDIKTTNRGGGCMVYVYPLTYHPLSYCGTFTNELGCSSCVGDGTGAETISGDYSFEIPAPQSFSISCNFSTSVIIITDNNQIGPIAIPANGCEVFNVDANCEVSN
ncbi:MAG: hypothetical protein ACKVT2_19185 [Saprospiraceae bacterium]